MSPIPTEPEGLKIMSPPVLVISTFSFTVLIIASTVSVFTYSQFVVYASTPNDLLKKLKFARRPPTFIDPEYGPFGNPETFKVNVDFPF